MAVEIPPPLDREKPIRVAVLAEGAITPLGNSANETWEAFLAGRTGIVEHRYPPYTEPLKSGDDPQIRTTTAGTIKNFNPREYLVKPGIIPWREVRQFGSYVWYGLIAGFEALRKVRTFDGIDLLVPRIKKDGSLDENYKWIINKALVHPLYAAAMVGCGFGGGDVSAEVMELLKQQQIPSPDHMMRSLLDRAPFGLTKAFGLNGGAEGDVAACASSGKAMLNAIYRIAAGHAELALVVGTEGILDKPIASAMFDTLDALDRGRNPLKVSRSLHKVRNGFTIAEGAVAFVLADPDWAKRHRIPILYEIIGFGDVSGGEHAVAPNEIAQEQAMRLAKRRAEMHGPIKGKVFNSGHYTGTPLGEGSEMGATQNVLDKMRTIIYASKRLAGHMLGAAGNLSQFVAGRVLQEKVVSGMVFDGEVMEEVKGWDIPRETHPDPDVTDALTNQFGFGDSNVSLWSRVA